MERVAEAVSEGEVPQRRLVTIPRAAKLTGAFDAREICRKIRKGTLLQGVHYTLPHGSRPLIDLDAYLAFLNGADAALRAAAKPKRSTGGGRRRRNANLDLVDEVA